MKANRLFLFLIFIFKIREGGGTSDPFRGKNSQTASAAGKMIQAKIQFVTSSDFSPFSAFSRLAIEEAHHICSLFKVCFHL